MGRDDWEQVAARIREAATRRRQLLVGREQVVAEITLLLLKHDPIGINFGENTDEYEPEAESIALRLPTASSLDEVTRIAHEEFVRWFGGAIAGPGDRYREIGEQIWAIWRRAAR